MTVVSGKSDGTITVTPNGIPVYFQSEPKRLYRIGHQLGLKRPDDEWLLESARREATEEVGGWAEEGWREVPSVTTVLKVLDKPGLPWWGMEIGAEGVATLFRQGIVREHENRVLIVRAVRKPDRRKGEKFAPHFTEEWVVAGGDELADALNVQQLTVNHTVKKAGKRGQSVHDALEEWAKSGALPDPEIYPPTERGYIEALLAFFHDVPSLEPVGAEIIVASREYGYAGRYDLRCRTTEAHDVVVHRTPVKGPQYRRLLPGEFLTDLKTSGDIYPEHARQLEGLEHASVESGWAPTDHRGILQVNEFGEYKFKRSWATFADFEVVLNLWRSNQKMAEAERADRKRTA